MPDLANRTDQAGKEELIRVDAQTGSFRVFQNEPDQLNKILARRQIQRETNIALLVQILFVILVPSASAVFSFQYIEFKPLAALIGIAVAVIDICVIDRIIKKRTAESARLQEEFDCALFRLPWNSVISGAKIDIRRVTKKAKAAQLRGSTGSARNWYPASLEQLPFSLGRLAAQRLNMSYDYRLRSQYKTVLAFIAAIPVAIVCFSVFQEQSTLQTVVLGALVPITPVFNWCVREGFRQHDALVRLRYTKAIAEDYWESLTSDRAEKADDDQDRSRRLQDASFIRRSTSPIVFGLLYWIQRSSLERRMLSEADVMVLEGAIG